MMLSAVALVCDNGCSGSEGVGSTARSLTHLLDLGERGLGMKPTRECSIDGCDRPVEARGWCKMHYSRWYASGTPGEAAPRIQKWATADEKFDALVARGAPDQCWPWMASLNIDGYGVLWIPGERFYVMAHRFAYERERGAIPTNMVLDHTCHTLDVGCVGLCEHRRCCNPAHLEIVTSRENTMRGRGVTKRNGERPRCINGHPFTHVRADGARACGTCDRDRQRARRSRNIAAGLNWRGEPRTRRPHVRSEGQ